MPDFSYSKNNVIGLIILFLIFLNIRADNRKMKPDERMFLLIIYTTSILMLCDIIIVAITGMPGKVVRQVNYVLLVSYFILSPVPYLAWTLYTNYYIYKSRKRLKKIEPIALIPAVISIILCVLSIFNKSVFSLDEFNIYKRGNLFMFNAAFYYSYFAINYIQIIINRKKLSKKNFYALFSFAVLPSIGGILQIVDTSQSYIWLAMSISILIIYLDIQNQEINVDYLTGLFNRRQLDKYLENSIREREEGESIFLIMLDVNRFKYINDKYGHIEGDKALIQVANILIENFGVDDFVSRYAGDEFVIIVKLEDARMKEDIINRLRSKFDEFNTRGITPYHIGVSIGYDIYKPELEMNVHEFIRSVDKLMYEDKEKYRINKKLMA